MHRGLAGVRKAALPRQWCGTAEYGGTCAVLRSSRPMSCTFTTPFPAVGLVLYACRDAGVPGVTTLHNYKLACASGDFFRDGAVCHDMRRRPPVGAIRHGCYRARWPPRACRAPAVAHRRASDHGGAYSCISASQRDLLRGVGLPRTGCSPAQHCFTARVS